MARSFCFVWASISLLLFVTSVSHADEPKVETILSGLRHPSGVAVRPSVGAQLYDVYVGESGGQRIVKVRNDQLGESTAVIQDFPAASDKGLSRPGNPLALLFLNPELLVVGLSGSLPEVRLYELNENGEPLAAEQAKQRIALPMPAEVSDLPLGACFALSRTRPNDQVPDLLLVAVVGDARVSGIWKAPIRAGTLSEMKRLETKPDKAGYTPAGVALSEQGFVVVAKSATAADSIAETLAFQTPTTGAAVMQMPIERHDIAGLTFATKSPNLYALDMARRAPAEGGVFRIDDASQPGRPACKMVRIQTVYKPTALAFGPDGALYVTAWNDADGRDDQGVLLRIKGDL